MTLLLVMVPVFFVGLTSALVVYTEEINAAPSDVAVLHPSSAAMLHDTL
jgi:hypothetical protein